MKRTEDELRNDTDDRLEDLERLAGNLRRSVVAILSNAIRRQHLPPGLTFDSELWDRLRDLDGDGACSAVSNEIEQVQSLLRRGGGEMMDRPNDRRRGAVLARDCFRANRHRNRFAAGKRHRHLR